jgi:hypothetical protein
MMRTGRFIKKKKQKKKENRIIKKETFTKEAIKN